VAGDLPGGKSPRPCGLGSWQGPPEWTQELDIGIARMGWRASAQAPPRDRDIGYGRCAGEMESSCSRPPLGPLSPHPKN
jgi:hypothetical protein